MRYVNFECRTIDCEIFTVRIEFEPPEIDPSLVDNLLNSVSKQCPMCGITLKEIDRT